MGFQALFELLRPLYYTQNPGVVFVYRLGHMIHSVILRHTVARSCHLFILPIVMFILFRALGAWGWRT